MPKKYLHHHIVYIPDEECYGVIVSMGAHVSLVKYTVDGLDCEVFILNEELIFVEDISIGLEEEEF